MSTITRERLEQLASGNAWVCVQDDEVAELARIALASLEAEAVADVVAWSSPNEERICDVRLRRHDINPGPLYTAPPAPVSVPDEDLPHMAASAIEDLLSNIDRSGAGVWADIPAKLRRAAMLQGADGNSPVIPDGWVACSERMPDKLIPVMVMYADGEMWSSIWTGTKWDDGTDFPDPHAVTHWQEMPAAPQQEVKP